MTNDILSIEVNKTYLIIFSIDAQLFSNSFEGVHGVVKKSGRGPLFSCSIAFLCYNFSKSFEGVQDVHTLSPPPLAPLCASMIFSHLLTPGILCNITIAYFIEVHVFDTLKIIKKKQAYETILSTTLFSAFFSFFISKCKTHTIINLRCDI